MRIQAFKLNIGEEIVSQVKSFDLETKKYTLEKPRTIMMTPGQDRQLHLSLVPWMVASQDPDGSAECDVKLHDSAVIGEAVTVPEKLEKGYMQNISTIQLLS